MTIKSERDNLLKINNFLLIANGDCIFFPPTSSMRCRFVLSEVRKVSTRWADVEGKEFQTVMSQSFHNSVLTLTSQMERDLCLYPRAIEQHRRGKWKSFDSGRGGIINSASEREQRKINPENEERKVQG